MLNPEILLRGDDNKHRHLLVEFEEFDRANEEEHAKVEYHSFKNNSDTL
ncbi:replication/maintenance protein RepL [Staphylococcus delphini]|nr:replication/maintenance protein RepL [Staphylococcus delphini]PCF78219.1 replication protein RepL [Staphylococcus delphini]